MKVDTNKLLENKKYCEEIFKYFLKRRIMLENKNKLFEKHINKSLNNLEFANFILEEHNHSIKEKLPNKTFYDWCITIYYYAVYHSALALLSKAGFESKNHLATISAVTLFYYHKANLLKREDIEFLIKNISLEKSEIKFIIESKDLRERACYNADELFELNQAKKLQKETAEFVNKIRRILEEGNQEEKEREGA